MEFWKFVKDYNFTNYIVADEVAVLFKLVKVKVHKDTKELIFLDYKGFKELMFQPPIDMTHLPPVFMIDKFVEHVKVKFKNEGWETEFFEDPDKFNVYGDTEIIVHLNNKLKADPEAEIPPSYDRVMHKEIEYKPTFWKGLKVSDSYKMCYMMISEALRKTFEIDILELAPDIK